MRKTTIATLTAAGLVSLFATNARAQAVANALQLGLGTGFITYSNPTYTEHNHPVLGGVHDETISTPTTVWGLNSRSGITLEGGYGINDMFVIGGLLQLGGWSTSIETTQYNGVGAQTGTIKQRESVFDLFLAPKLDVMFMPDSRVRPFVGGALGLVHYSRSIENTTANNVIWRSYDGGWTGLGLMARAGIRWFLTPGFSIDPAFVFGGSFMSGSTTHQLNQGTAALNYDTGVAGYTLGLNVAFSGWVGL